MNVRQPAKQCQRSCGLIISFVLCYFVLFVFLNLLVCLTMCVKICLYVSIQKRVQESMEARAVRPPRTGIVGSCELPDMNSGNWSSASTGPTLNYWIFSSAHCPPIFTKDSIRNHNCTS